MRQLGRDQNEEPQEEELHSINIAVLSGHALNLNGRVFLGFAYLCPARVRVFGTQRDTSRSIANVTPARFAKPPPPLLIEGVPSHSLDAPRG
jgi:hypothetical protein